MKKIEKLIKEYCPDGVKYKKLGDVAIMKRGTSLTKKNATDGDIPVISGGRQPAFYCNQSNRDGETITVAGSGAGAGYVQYWDKPIFACDCFTVKGTEKLDTRYIYHWMTSIQDAIYGCKKGGGVPHVHVSDVDCFKIPVPPLPVQEEIVRILDTFTELTTELTAELAVELTARKKQYEYYKDKLLIKQSKYKSVKLNTVCEIYDGTHQTPNYTESGIPFVSVENIENLFGTNKYILENDYAKYKIKPCKGDVFMTRIGSIGKCAIMECNKDLAYYVSLALLRPNENILNSHYLKHYLESGLGKKELAKRTLTNAVPIKINKTDIGKINIIIPPIEIQSKIAEILDNFESICSNLNIGLPAEVEARQKQYEYYRNKLLTFKKLDK